MVREWNSSIFDLFVVCLSENLSSEDSVACGFRFAIRKFIAAGFLFWRGFGEVFASLQKEIPAVSPFLPSFIHSFTPSIFKIAMSIPLDEFVH